MTTLPVILSPGFTPTVKVNDLVTIGQAIARKEGGKEYTIDLASQFGESEEKVRKYLVKNPGDNVKAGEVLAVKRGFLGMSEEKLVVQVEGVFSRYERERGLVIITTGEKEESFDMVSPVDGKVVICDNERVVLEVEKDVYPGLKGAGGAVSGEVYVLDGAFPQGGSAKESEISLYYELDSRAVGKIVIGSSFARDILIKCIGMGAIGIVGTEIRDEDLEYLAKRHLAVPIIEVDSETVEKVKKWKGKKFYLNSPEKVILFLHA